jgi:hypothetical protein
MDWSEIPRHPSVGTLRWFAALGTMALGGATAWQFLVRGNTPFALLLAAVGLTFAAVGALWPVLLRPVFIGSLMVTFPLNWLVSHLALALVYYGLVTPLACFFRVIGRDILARRPAQGRDSYWAPKPVPADLKSYFHQS